MPRTALLVIVALFVVLGGALILAQSNTFSPSGSTTVSTEEGTRVDAPGTRVESDGDKTRIQAPGVDITVPRNKDND